MRPRGCGGIGRRARFRSVWGQPRGGSSPLIRIANRSTRACFFVVLLLARNLSRRRADVSALEAQKRTGGRQPDTRSGPADRTRRELLRAKPLMQVEIGHRCGRRADFHIVCLDAASDNGPNGLSRVEKVLALADPRSSVSSWGTTSIGSLGPGTAESFVAEGVRRLAEAKALDLPAPSSFLALSRAPVGVHEPKGRSLRCVPSPVQLQADPERHPGLGIAQLDLSRLHARWREADDNVGPPLIGDGVSDQHVPQFAPPRDVSLSLAREDAASTHQRYGSLSSAPCGAFSHS